MSAWATNAKNELDAAVATPPPSLSEIMKTEKAEVDRKKDAERKSIVDLQNLLPQLNFDEASKLLATCQGDVALAIEKAFALGESGLAEMFLSPDGSGSTPQPGLDGQKDTSGPSLEQVEGSATDATASDYALALELAEQERCAAALHVERQNQRRPGSKIVLTSPYEVSLERNRRSEINKNSQAMSDFVETEPVRPNGIEKHDPDLCGLYNAQRLSTRMGVGTLDAGTKISGRVFNKMQAHLGGKSSRKTHKGMTNRGRVAKETRGTSGAGVLDQRTRQIVLSLINDSTIDNVGGVIATGKEASAFVARGVGFPVVDEPNTAEMNSSSFSDADEKSAQKAPVARGFGVGKARIVYDLVLKIFRTSLSAFKNRGEYVDGDARFSRSKFRSLNTRKALALWAEKEYRNLVRMHRAGVPVPEPLSFSQHCVVMRMVSIGAGKPAPQLREVPRLSAPRLRAIFIQVVLAMRMMYQRARLVHGDLSAFNILYEGGKHSTIKVIDVGQAVDLSHPNHMKYLIRDCRTIVDYFDRQSKAAGVNFGIPSLDEVICFVVEKDEEDNRVCGTVEEGKENASAALERQDKKWRKSFKRILANRM